MDESEDGRERGLACLMKAYEHDTLGALSEMLEIWSVPGRLLMERNLGLQVSTILQP